MTNIPVTLPSYHITDSIYGGSRTLVYRGIRAIDEQAVIIKVLRNPHPHFNELVQFRNQYLIACPLEHSHILQPLALEWYGNGYALIMPDKEMIDLPDYWRQSEQSLRDFLFIALQLTEVLHYLTQQHIVHKDIKPANILIHPQTQHVELIDFSIASLLSKEQQQLVNPNVLEGTLAYISPEQTGRMNRGIDYRTDFYSLGVTFYELLYGELPFTSDDPMELIHCHIAREVQFPSDSNIPEVLQEILLKLMAKNAEERYQSALGLKHDLERCLQLLETTGEIADFPLGERDICDRLTIPDKLYGREREVCELLAAFARVSQGVGEPQGQGDMGTGGHGEGDRGDRTSSSSSPPSSCRSELLLVAGFSGIGKTAVVNEIHKPIIKQRGYFIKGKFDQFNRNVPLSAFVQAFRDLMGQLLSESDAQLTQWRGKILEAVGENGQVLIEVIPELEQVISKQPPAQKLSGTATQNRFNLLFQKFVAVFTTVEHPLVIFLDDLQWADSTSLQLIKLLMEEQNYLLLVGAYRNNEVASTHPFMVMLEEFKQQQMSVNTITLAPLKFDDINQLIADTLNCDLERSQPLARLIFRKTQGNPFFTKQFLKALYEDGQITFNNPQGYWECDIAQVSGLSLTDNVVEFMAEQLKKLPKETQQILTLGACIGNQFDLATLAIISEQSQIATATALWKALQEGFILPMSQTYKFFQVESEEKANLDDSVNLTYRFLHDRVQQAAYTLVPEELKESTHTTIGKLLLANTPIDEQEEKIFDIVGQLNHGIESLKSDREKEELIHLNLKAGTKAQESTAYSVASYHFNLGIKLLTKNSWDTHYKTCLMLYENAAESAFINGDFQLMNSHLEEIFKNGKLILDKIKSHEIQLQSYIAQNQPLIAVKTALLILNELGEEITLNPEISEIESIIGQAKNAFKDKDIAQIVKLPLNQNLQKLAIIKILTTIHSATFFAAPQLIPVEICTRIILCLKYGNSPESAHIYADYGLLLCGVLGDIETGYAFGELALAVTEIFPLSGIQARAKIVTYMMVTHWKESLRSLFIPFKIAYQETLESGDLEYTAYGVFFLGAASFLAGRELTEFSNEMVQESQVIVETHQELPLRWYRIYQQTVSNLIKTVEQPWILAGDYYDEHKSIPQHYEASEFAGLFMAQTNKLMVAYLLENYEAAYEYANIAEQYTASATAMLLQPYFFFYDSLLYLEYYASSEAEDNQLFLERVKRNQEKMKQWGYHCPANYLHKYHLVEARKCQSFKQYLEAIKFYTLAISEAKENEYLQEEALANELTAKFYLDWGQEKAAQGYMQEAYYCYARWGAKAKTNHLEKTYPQLLTPILQQPKNSFTLNNFQNVTQTIQTVSIASSVLDFNSAIKASQILSEEIELDALLSKLIRIIRENSGATKATLILNNSDTWEIVAHCENNTCSLCRIALEQSQTLPLSMINTVKRTQKALLINHVQQENPFVGDPYFIQQQPNSLFCIPILHQGKFIGILYLENHLIQDTFTPERISVINLLTAQAAIALENAGLYNRLEEYSKNLEVQVEQRTQELQEKIQKLQQTQAQLIQAEKMSALGQMVAGIAHEINNPISFIYGNLTHAKDYINHLMSLLRLYEYHYPQPHPDISQTIEDIELDFLKEDISALLQSMEVGTERIQEIVKSLRIFSRLDESTIKFVNLHEGIDSTLTILQTRLRAQDWRSEIQVVKDYGDLPKVKCYAGQLNQVFMSILSNAIDAIEQKLREENSGIDQGMITIQTKMLSEQQIMVSIQDNGIGIPSDVLEKIFDPFFTTKEVGKGTGLGMAIAHQIITEKHGGILSCLSELGKGTNFILKIPLSSRHFWRN